MRGVFRNPRTYDWSQASIWPTTLACHHLQGDAETTSLLLEHGASPHTEAANGDRPLHSAANSGHEPVVRLLMEKGASPLVYNRRLRTPLHLAAGAGHVDVIATLLQPSDKGADKSEFRLKLLSLRDASGQTALHSAVQSCALSAVQLCVEQGADLHTKDYNDAMPITLADKVPGGGSFHLSALNLLSDLNASVGHPASPQLPD